MGKKLFVPALAALALAGCGRRHVPPGDEAADQAGVLWKAEAEYSRGNDDRMEPTRETARIKVRLLTQPQPDGDWEVRAQWVALNTSRSPMFPRGIQYVLRLQKPPGTKPDVAKIRFVPQPGQQDGLFSAMKLGTLPRDAAGGEWNLTVELGSAVGTESPLIQQRIRFTVRRRDGGGLPLVTIRVRQGNPGARYGLVPTPLLFVRAEPPELFEAAGDEKVAPYPPWPGDIREPLPRKAGGGEESPLLRGARAGDEQALRAALRQGQRLDEEDELGQTALDLLYLHGHYHVLAALAPGHRDVLGLENPLNQALLAQDHPGFARLLREGRSPNVPARAGYVVSPLELATRRNDLPAMRLLLDADADAVVGTHTGGGPLDLALDADQLDAARLLLAGRDSPTWGVMTAASRGNLAMVKVFGDHNPRSLTGQMPPTQQTALMMAARFGREEVIGYLLTKGADPALKDVQGHTALDYARASGRPEVIRALREADAKGR